MLLMTFLSIISTTSKASTWTELVDFCPDGETWLWAGVEYLRDNYYKKHSKITFKVVDIHFDGNYQYDFFLWS